MEMALISEHSTRISCAAALRAEIVERARRYAQAEELPHCLSYGEAPAVCFAPYEDSSRHGNFLQRSYAAIKANPAWIRRAWESAYAGPAIFAHD